jgi:hypothetical protein
MPTNTFCIPLSSYIQSGVDSGGARRGNLCQTRYAPFYIEIASSRFALLAMTNGAFVLLAMTRGAFAIFAMTYRQRAFAVIRLVAKLKGERKRDGFLRQT